MISTIIEALDLAASGKLPTTIRHGLAELQPEIGPAVFNGTDWTPIGNDNGTFSYWRLTGPVRERVGESALTCANVFTVTYPMRLVSVVDRTICTDVVSHARAAATAVRGVERELRTVLGANLVEVGSANVLTSGVYRAEFGADDVLPTGKSIVAIDITVSVTGNATCFDPCDDTKSLLCSLVEAATWAKIKACMSEGQIDDAEADLCDGGGPCDPTTVNGVESDTPTITVVQGGVEVGTLNPATGVHTVPECPVPPVPECDDLVDAVVVEGAGLDNVNGLYRRDDSAPVPDDNPNIITRRYTLIGPPQRVIFGIEINPGEIFWTIWCVPDEQTLYDSNPSENPWGAEWVDAADNPPPPTVRQATIGDICGGGDCPACEDVTVQLRDSAGNNIGLPDVYAAGTNTTKTAPDGSVQRRDSAGNAIGSLIPVRSNQTGLDVTCPDGTVTILNLNGTALGSQAVRSNATASYTAPIPLKFTWAAGDADTRLWTVTDDEAGTYATYTQTGSNGTVTYSKNGAAYAPLSGTIALAVGDTITVRRTTTTNAGSTRWVP